MTEPQIYCTECGAELHGAKFCPHCGVITENAPVAVGAREVEAHGASGNGAGGNGHASALRTSQMPVSAPRIPRPPGSGGAVRAPGAGGAEETTPARSRKTLLIAGAAALVVVAAAVAIVLATRGGGGTSYAQQVRGVLAPVIRSNGAMSQRLQALGRTSGSGAARTAVARTSATVAAAQQMLAGLSPASADRTLSSAAQVALTSEAGFLDAARAVLADSRSARAAEIAALGETTHGQLLALDPEVPGASVSFGGWQSLSAYTRQRSSDTAVRAFSRQVDALLAQSAGSFEEINHVFGQMQIAASGGVPGISLAQAEASLGSVISNRNALAASARTLSAPSAQATNVRDALAGAFDASLTNDRDIQECLDEANSGSVAFIFQSCLSSTAGSSGAATAAKQHFVSAYNDLRRSAGLASVQPSF